jgi:hypothetical protein
MARLGWALVFAGAAVMATATAGCWVARTIQADTTLACMASVQGALASLPEPELRMPNVGQGSQALSTDETDRLVALAATAKSVDCHDGPIPPLQDKWNHRVEISVRRGKSGVLRFRLRSAGGDGSWDTSDDLVSALQVDY